MVSVLAFYLLWQSEFESSFILLNLLKKNENKQKKAAGGWPILYNIKKRIRMQKRIWKPVEQLWRKSFITFIFVAAFSGANFFLAFLLRLVVVIVTVRAFSVRFFVAWRRDATTSAATFRSHFYNCKQTISKCWILKWDWCNRLTNLNRTVNR